MPVRKIPLLHVQGGRLVHPDLKGGWVDAGQARAHGPELKALKALYDEAQDLYVLDLDGQENGVANLNTFQALERGHIFPWVDAGCRRAEDAVDAFFAGATALTINVRHMDREALGEFGEISDGDFHIGLTVDAAGIEGVATPADAVALAQDAGATGVVFYEGTAESWTRVEEHVRALERDGVPATWVARPGSTSEHHAFQGGLFQNVVAWRRPA